MGFHRQYRRGIQRPDSSKKVVKLDGPPAHREMLVQVSLIVVQMNLQDLLLQGFPPNGHRSTGKGVLMAHIEAKSQKGTREPVKDLPVD
jgi:hypothetical protein